MAVIVNKKVFTDRKGNTRVLENADRPISAIRYRGNDGEWRYATTFETCSVYMNTFKDKDGKEHTNYIPVSAVEERQCVKTIGKDGKARYIVIDGK